MLLAVVIKSMMVWASKAGNKVPSFGHQTLRHIEYVSLLSNTLIVMHTLYVNTGLDLAADLRYVSGVFYPHAALLRDIPCGVHVTYFETYLATYLWLCQAPTAFIQTGIASIHRWHSRSVHYTSRSGWTQPESWGSKRGQRNGASKGGRGI